MGNNKVVQLKKLGTLGKAAPQAAKPIVAAFKRALRDMIQPRVLGLSLVPLLVIGILLMGLGVFFWADALTVWRGWLAGFGPVVWLNSLLTGWGIQGVASVIAPLLLLLLALPVIIISSLLVVALFLTPALTRLVADKHYNGLVLPAGAKGASLLTSVLWSLGSTALAVLALLVSMPLWLIPPFFLLLPPLIWGWLTYRVMAFDALADHASSQERQFIFKEHRMRLLGIGILSGYLGTVPGLVGAFGVLSVVLLPFLLPLAIWLYVLVFIFSSLWFAHYALNALVQLRGVQSA